MNVAIDPDVHVADWPDPSLHDPLQAPDPEPPEPSGWHRPGGDPAQPDKTLPSVFELHAEGARAARGEPPREQPEKPAKKTTRRQRRRR